MGDQVVRVFIVDDQPQVRSALKLLLKQESDMMVVGEASSLTKALELIADLQPEVLLLDWGLTGPGAAEAFSTLRAVSPDLLVVALSGRPEARGAAMDAGADAFVSKGDPPEQLLATIEACRGRLARASWAG